MKRNKIQRADRHGTTMIECVVAATVLMVAMTTVTTVIVRAGRVWHDIADQRIALNELSNQIDSLLERSATDDGGRTAESIDRAIANLEVSEMAKTSLNEPTLTGTIASDPLGTRVTLTMTWEGAFEIVPVELTTWLETSETPK